MEWLCGWGFAESLMRADVKGQGKLLNEKTGVISLLISLISMFLVTAELHRNAALALPILQIRFCSLFLLIKLLILLTASELLHLRLVFPLSFLLCNVFWISMTPLEFLVSNRRLIVLPLHILHIASNLLTEILGRIYPFCHFPSAGIAVNSCRQELTFFLSRSIQDPHRLYSLTIFSRLPFPLLICLSKWVLLNSVGVFQLDKRQFMSPCCSSNSHNQECASRTLSRTTWFNQGGPLRCCLICRTSLNMQSFLYGNFRGMGCGYTNS